MNVILYQAMDWVRAAARVSEAAYAGLGPGGALTKSDLSPVTVADFGVQALILDRIGKAFPEDRIVAEEEASDLRDPENEALWKRVMGAVQVVDDALDGEAMLGALDRGKDEGGAEGGFWTLDPVDGTKGFLRGEQYAIALARVERGRPVLGVLGCPRLTIRLNGAELGPGLLFFATRGDGAWVAELREGAQAHLIRASGQVTASDLVFCESVESGHSAHGHSEQIAQRLGVKAEPLRLDSQAKYGCVASGQADAYLRLPTRADYREKIWDHAAGVLIVEEAGGVVTDVEGKELDFSLGRTLRENRGVVAAAPGVHATLMAAVAEVLGS
ncbi:MAG TPA: 3'(2'),5'-bisphosphate nucleotidase [Kiritimatiellia bacterium]|nr:3'(2'),5'-bisphosphate nucleotidase [Kiritimatiellia bacterium]